MELIREVEANVSRRGLGAERHCDIKGFGGIDEVITEWDEGRGYTYQVTPIGPLGVSYNRWAIVELDASTSKIVVDLSYDVRFGFLGTIMHTLMMRPKLKRAFPKGLKALKNTVETGKLVRPRRSRPGEPQLAMEQVG